jgi:4-hydroxy-tetrahydrodipicolinate synthase
VPAGAKYSELLAATAGRLHVSGGWAVMQMIEALDRGVHAFMPTGLHAIYARIYQLHRAGQRQAARDLFEKVLPILAFANQHLDISIHFFKRLLWAQGIYPTTTVRQPSLPFDETHARVAQELIARACALEAAIGAQPAPA